MARRKIRIGDKVLLGGLFFRMQPAQFFRIFQVEESEMRSLLAIAAMEKAAKEERAVSSEEWKEFDWYLKVLPRSK